MSKAWKGNQHFTKKWLDVMEISLEKVVLGEEISVSRYQARTHSKEV